MYPGTARNIGIKLANSKYIAFFDVNTFPDNLWLESYSLINKMNLDYLIGTRITLSNSFLKTQINFPLMEKSLYSCYRYNYLEKYLLKKNLFFDTRAGEDIEWITRLTNKQDYKINKKIYFIMVYLEIFF